MSYSPGLSGLGGLAEGFASAYNTTHQAALGRELDQRHQLANIYMSMLPNLRPEALPQWLNKVTQIYATPPNKPIARNKDVTDFQGFLNTPVPGGQPTNISPQVPLGPPAGFQVSQPSPATPGGVSTSPSPNAGLTPPPNITPVGAPTQTTQLGQQTLTPPPVSPMYTPEERIAQQASAAGSQVSSQIEARINAVSGRVAQLHQQDPSRPIEELVMEASMESGLPMYGMASLFRPEQMSRGVKGSDAPNGTVTLDGSALDPNKFYDLSRQVGTGQVLATPSGVGGGAEADRQFWYQDPNDPTRFLSGFVNRAGQETDELHRPISGITKIDPALVPKLTQHVEQDRDGNFIKIGTVSQPLVKPGGGARGATQLQPPPTTNGQPKLTTPPAANGAKAALSNPPTKTTTPAPGAPKGRSLGANEEPVFAFDPKTGEQTYTTRGDAEKNGLTNIGRPVSPQEVEKESQYNRQLNDVQVNISKYRKSVDALPGAIPPDHVQRMTQITAIADQLDRETGGGVIGQLSLGMLPVAGNQLLQGELARAWNYLSPQEREVMTGYFRARQAILAYQKVITGSGRQSQLGTGLELPNIPEPIVGASVADPRFDSFQQNIDIAGKGLVKFPWIENHTDLRKSIEAPSGQLANPPQDLGPAPQGTKDGDTGKFDGVPAVIRGGRIHAR